MKTNEKILNTDVQLTTQHADKSYMVGMKNVDPGDIRPPQILLVQKSSDFNTLTDPSGVQAKIGQYYHTGQLKIMDDFECYILYAAKSTYIDKMKPEKGELNQYKIIGMLAKDLTIFGMTFRSSAVFTLSPLFTTVLSTRKPMYLHKCLFETKELTGKMGTWNIPVLRILGIERNTKVINELENMAVKLKEKEISETTEDENPDDEK